MPADRNKLGLDSLQGIMIIKEEEKGSEEDATREV